MVTRAAVVALLLLLPALARAQQPRLSFSILPGGVVAATLPASVLSEPNVNRRLDSGLTATFLLSARQRATAAVSGARIEIRYDLWDEVWIVRRIEFDRKTETQRLPSREALERWWRTPVRLLATQAARVALQIDLNVLPFSAAEEADAREWISKAGGVGTAAGGGAGLVDALIGTTISARPITSYRWNVEVTLR
jgi:hypothetical protein